MLKFWLPVAGRRYGAQVVSHSGRKFEEIGVFHFSPLQNSEYGLVKMARLAFSNHLSGKHGLKEQGSPPTVTSKACFFYLWPVAVERRSREAFIHSVERGLARRQQEWSGLVQGIYISAAGDLQAYEILFCTL
jgi:hypothetical protein